jgi:hypothetical protein
MNARAFNASKAGHGRYVGRGYGGRGCGCGRMQGRGCGLLAYVGGIPQGGGFPQESFPSTMGHLGSPMGTPHGPPGQFQGGNAGGPSPYPAPPMMNGRYGPTGGYGMPLGPYSNVVKHFANWNACYLCGFDIGNGHKSMTCPTHLHKVSHQVGFNCQNAQQYIDMGYPCSTRMRHKTQLPTNM